MGAAAYNSMFLHLPIPVGSPDVNPTETHPTHPTAPRVTDDGASASGGQVGVQVGVMVGVQVGVMVGVLMGSSSDWETMRQAALILTEFGVVHECRVVSAHRMPDEMFAYAEAAAGRGLRAIIAGAGGAAHLPGMLAAKTTVPVLGVPVASKHLSGVDSLHSIVMMPKGIPVATFAIGAAGAANAALFAVAMLATGDAALRERLEAFRARQTETARAMTSDLT